MKLKLYGTRGSTPVSGPKSVRYGGNTTCLRIDSQCLPRDHWLLVDAGTGIVPASWDFMAAGGMALTLLQTHYHHDHTQGLALSVFPYTKHIPVMIYGPHEYDRGPKEVYHTLIQHPFFPVQFDEVCSHFHFHGIPVPKTTVFVIHPLGGVKRFVVDEFERLLAAGKQLPFRGQHKFSVEECLVIKLHPTHHPDLTISYRFEERPTGQVLVFLTDHENEVAISASLRVHLTGADQLVVDCQYTEEKYERQTAGWGHSTPQYVSRLAHGTGVRALGLTHHDPPSSDALIDEIVATAGRCLREAGSEIPVFGCRDYMALEIGEVPKLTT